MDANNSATEAYLSIPAGMTEDDLDQSDLSDKEDAEKLDLSPFKIDWLTVGCDQKLGISILPGCRYMETWRSLKYDLMCLQKEGVQDIFCFCQKREFFKYRTKKLLSKYSEAGFTVHHCPIEDGEVPQMDTMMTIVEDIRLCVLGGRKTLVHCFGGLGRSCAVAACLLMSMDESLTSETAIQRLKDLRGPRAIYSVKQYNYVNEFKEKIKEFKQEQNQEGRSVSR